MMKQAAYRVIYQDLLQGILSGRWPEGSTLPTENELAAQYSVSRITSRQALSMLAYQGSILRVQGRGSVVAKPPERQAFLGLALSDFDSLFGTELIKGVFHQASQLGYQVLMQTGYHVSEGESECLQRLVRSGVQGIIDVPLYDAMRFTPELQTVSEQLPLVLADRRVLDLNVPLVCTDNMGGTQMLCSRLRGNGYRSLAFISGRPESTAVTERIKGFLQSEGEQKRHLLTSIRSVLPGMSSPENEAYDIAQIERFLVENQDVQAVIAHTYAVAELVHRAMDNLGLKVPRDCAIMCFDAPRVSGQQFSYAHMRQNEYEIGALAVRRLVDLIAGRSVPDMTYVDAVFVDGGSYLQR